MTSRQFALSLLVLMFSGLAGGAISGRIFQAEAQSAPAGLVAAREIRLVDESGRTRALLSLLRERPRFIMLDEIGEFRIELGLGEGSEPSVRLRDREGRPRLELALGAAGEPRVELSDGQDRDRVSIHLGAGGAPALLIRDEAGRDRLALWQEKEEMGLALADSGGRPRAGFTLRQGDVPSMAFYDSDGRAVWYAPPKP
ncbi:MAG: hypothetical protein AB1896_03980 [Thermodesulfobacteriota bacterium]